MREHIHTDWLHLFTNAFATAAIFHLMQVLAAQGATKIPGLGTAGQAVGAFFTFG